MTLAKPDAMQAAVQAAEAKGIPVVAFNSGADAWQAMGVKEYFGQDGYIAGQERRQAAAAEGAKKVICVIQEQGHVELEARCAGVKNSFPAIEILNVNGKDMPSVESTITAKLQQDPSVDYVVALGCADRADRGAVGEQRRQLGQGRHLRHQRRAGRRDQER